ncbi:MAG: DUF5134 domain-containing protein [Propionibacteriaceae bacterium]|nr:DUF5134 domain-containing protein [Propionibacteriaceae bacterium]
MFSFAAVPVKFVGLFVLFAWCTVWSVYELTRPQSGRQRVSNALHLAMAVAMLLMVARPTWMGLTAIIPLWVLVGFFAFSVFWFAGLGLRAFVAAQRKAGWHFAGHATMFAAMAWHLAAMAVMRPLHDAMMPARQPGGVLWWFAVAGVPLMAYLLAASVRALRSAVAGGVAGGAAGATASDCCGGTCSCGSDCTCGLPRPALDAALPAGGGLALAAPAVQVAASCHEVRPVGSPKYRMAAWSDVAMNFGMFWMSTGIMVPLLPFFASLSF